MMKLFAAWRNFWFKEAPYFDLAVLRLLAVGLQLFILLNTTFNSITYATGRPDDMFNPNGMLRFFLLPWGWDTPPGSEVMFTVYTITVVTGFLSFLGILTNVSLIIFALGNLFIQSHAYSFGDIHHPEAIMMLALLALALSPSGRVLSVDALVKERLRGPSAGPSVPLLEYSGVYARWPILFLQLFFPLMYLSAVLGKLGRSGLEWMNGFTLQAVMIQDYYRHGSELALWMSQHHDFLKFAQVIVILFQVTFFLVVPFPKLRWIYLPIGLGFHFMILFTLRAAFPQWICLYAIYIPWSKMFEMMARKRVAVIGSAPAPA